MGRETQSSVSYFKTLTISFLIKYRKIETIKSIVFLNKNIPTLSQNDVDRLNNDTSWLTDSHVNFALQYVLVYLPVSLSELSRHWFSSYSSKNIWGNLKIKLLDSTFWALITKEPYKFNKKFRDKYKLLEYDFVVVPMHGE
jgi:hypothetical protein